MLAAGDGQPYHATTSGRWPHSVGPALPPDALRQDESANEDLCLHRVSYSCKESALRAIISDIHANLEALEAVLADIRQQGITEIFCLGDIIGYGPNPCECIDRVYSCNCACSETTIKRHCLIPRDSMPAPNEPCFGHDANWNQARGQTLTSDGNS